MRATFKKSERLSGKKLLGEIHREGKAVKAFPFILLYKPCSFESAVPAKLAISIPKRKVKKAVDRNRMRRQVREVYRVEKPTLYTVLTGGDVQLGMLIIFVGYESSVDSNLVKEKISTLIARLSNEISGDYQAKENHEEN